MASSLGPGDLETRNFPEMCSDRFYEKLQSFKLVSSKVFLQLRKDQQVGNSPC